MPKGIGRQLQTDIASKLPDEEFDAQQAVNAVLRDFVNTCTDYLKIFGGERPIIDRVDMILTSIGDIAGSEADPLYLDMRESEGIEHGQLQAITSGNICGAWLPAEPKNQLHLDEVDGINDRWLGIKQQQIVDCAMRAAIHADATAPGVVVVAAAPKQAKIIRQAVGMINTLVISPELARALLELGETESA